MSSSVPVPGFVQEWIDGWNEVPAESKSRRVLLSALIGVSFCVTALRSLVFSTMPPIAMKWFPDVRLPFLFMLGFGTGLWASWGNGRRRVNLLWIALGVAFAFHLEEATVHWFNVGVEGSITGTRADFLGTLASLGGVALVLLLHAEVEAWRFARAVAKRGAEVGDARRAGRALSRAATRRIGALAGGAGALVLVVIVAEAGFGDANLGNGIVALLVGGGLLTAAAVLAWMAVRQGRESRDAPEEAVAESPSQDPGSG